MRFNLNTKSALDDMLKRPDFEITHCFVEDLL